MHLNLYKEFVFTLIMDLFGYIVSRMLYIAFLSHISYLLHKGSFLSMVVNRPPHRAHILALKNWDLKNII